MSNYPFDAEAVAELRYLATWARKAFLAEVDAEPNQRARHTASRRWKQAEAVLATLEAAVGTFEPGSGGYLVAWFIYDGAAGGMATRAQYPTREHAEAALAEQFSPAAIAFNRMSVRPTKYETSRGLLIRSDALKA